MYMTEEKPFFLVKIMSMDNLSPYIPQLRFGWT